MEKINYENVYLLLEKYGFSLDETVEIVNEISFVRLDDDSLGGIIENNIRYFINKEYSQNDIRTMILMCPRCLTVSDKKRKTVADILYSIGMTDDQMKKLSIKCGNIFAYSKERMMDFITFFRNMGYDDKNIVDVFLKTLNIFRSSVNNLEKLYDDMIEYGFTKTQVCSMGKTYPTFWSHSFKKIKSVLDAFIKFGFTKEQAIIILKKSPSLIGYGDDTIALKFNKLIELGFSKVQLINIVSEYPTLINSDINRTKNIVEFFTSIGLYDKLLEDPKGFFMQGIETSYARYCFYSDRNIEINERTYDRLFRGWKAFEKVYGIDKKTLLERYKYSEYKEGKCKKKN